ncbi:uncharacterized protein GGS25DRAFT_471682 [Hypoxylon fragiforme]|uniref:uncharacterized protein n=1 Tax=Hypoxylon fragiforme TaxID=63214 RepID=UPI0020C6A85D|nr:uncharacterized protein GGS25DRAFT_471682 [Hypoxylon fragiforme]KAI2614433.1 hypothetical protein GGS25DRAFT_471682 [Hypoxylon fragiforme]
MQVDSLGIASRVVIGSMNLGSLAHGGEKVSVSPPPLPTNQVQSNYLRRYFLLPPPLLALSLSASSAPLLALEPFDPSRSFPFVFSPALLLFPPPPFFSLIVAHSPIMLM